MTYTMPAWGTVIISPDCSRMLFVASPVSTRSLRLTVMVLLMPVCADAAAVLVIDGAADAGVLAGGRCSSRVGGWEPGSAGAALEMATSGPMAGGSEIS